jgi:hypothetical protein
MNGQTLYNYFSNIIFSKISALLPLFLLLDIPCEISPFNVKLNLKFKDLFGY